jgi:hypothetical protein
LRPRRPDPGPAVEPAGRVPPGTGTEDAPDDQRSATEARHPLRDRARDLVPAIPAGLTAPVWHLFVVFAAAIASVLIGAFPLLTARCRRRRDRA